MFSRNRLDWIVYHKNNPNAVNQSSKLDYKMYVLEADDMNKSTRETVLSSDFNNILHEGSNIFIPVIGVRTGSGIDGQIYGIEVPTGLMGSGSYQISWYMDGPHEWKPIIEWYKKAVDYLKHSLDG